MGVFVFHVFEIDGGSRHVSGWTRASTVGCNLFWYSLVM